MKGIYKILNKSTGDFYIGSTSISFSRRFTQHKSDLKKNKHRNIHLQRAYNRDGIDSFEYIILEVIEHDCEILKREQYYLDQKPHYNISTCAENNTKGLKKRPESIEKTRQANIGRIPWNKGKQFSEESKQKMSQSRMGKESPRKGKYGKNHNPVLRSDGKIYQNPTLAANELGVKPNTIIKAITDKNKIRKVKGYIFNYVQ